MGIPYPQPDAQFFAPPAKVRSHTPGSLSRAPGARCAQPPRDPLSQKARQRVTLSLWCATGVLRPRARHRTKQRSGVSRSPGRARPDTPAHGMPRLSKPRGSLPNPSTHTQGRATRGGVVRTSPSRATHPPPPSTRHRGSPSYPNAYKSGAGLPLLCACPNCFGRPSPGHPPPHTQCARPVCRRGQTTAAATQIPPKRVWGGAAGARRYAAAAPPGDDPPTPRVRASERQRRGKATQTTYNAPVVPSFSPRIPGVVPALLGAEPWPSLRVTSAR